VSQTTIFWPILAHMLLVCVLYMVLGWCRWCAVASGEATSDQYKVRTQEPARSVAVSNNLMNQYELPVLFYVLCLGLFVTNGVSYVALILAWLFVASRCLHSYVHVAWNDIRYRGRSFGIGFILVIAMAVLLALHLLGAA
jgi:hypothetical protein